MRICPKCGYLDHIMWRSAAFHPEFDYASFDQIETNDAELWELIKDKKPGEIICRDPYLYWKSIRSNTIRRIWIEDYKRVKKKGSWQEHVSRNSQTTLDGTCIKTVSSQRKWVNSRAREGST